MLNVISLGAGVQSTTMALMAAHGEIEPMPDAAIFADTGAEPQAVYEHLRWLMSPNVLPFPVHIIKWRDLRQDLYEAGEGRGPPGLEEGFVAPPFFATNEDGARAMLSRHCTQNYKLRPLERYIKVLLGRDPDKRIGSRVPLAVQWIGVSADEDHRVNNKGPGWIVKRYPLIDVEGGRDGIRIVGPRRMTRGDCKEWLRRNDYPEPPRSACTFCPYRNNGEWRDLRESPPDWADAIAIDELIRDFPAKGRGALTKGGHLYVHADRVPLAEAEIDRPDPGQLDIWDDECEGMCGV